VGLALKTGGKDDSGGIGIDLFPFQGGRVSAELLAENVKGQKRQQQEPKFETLLFHNP
jgi:hypothetical protein